MKKSCTRSTLYEDGDGEVIWQWTLTGTTVDPPTVPPGTIPDRLVIGILMSLGVCMKSETGLDFSDIEQVKANWAIIMDAAMPIDGRRQIHKPIQNITAAFWHLRNQPAAMPFMPNLKSYPHYGQFSDVQLAILNVWGEQNGLGSYAAAINTFKSDSCSRTTSHTTTTTTTTTKTTREEVTRYGVQEVYDKYKSQILDAFWLLRDKDSFPRCNPGAKTEDLGAWGDLVAIHGGPFQVYRDKAHGHGMWCWHRVFQFLPWHRPWLAAIESALVNAQKMMGCTNIIGLPYWDPTVPYQVNGKDTWRNGHPLFFEPTYESAYFQRTMANPLHAKNAVSLFDITNAAGNTRVLTSDSSPPSRRILRGWMTPNHEIENLGHEQSKHWNWLNTEYLRQLADPAQVDKPKSRYDVSPDEWYFDFSEINYPPKSTTKLKDWMTLVMGQAQYQTKFYVNKSEWENERSPVGWAQCIETVHNEIHNFIGQDCMDASIAGWDPILYFFHANIDRELQAVIQKNSGGKGFLHWLNQTPEGQPCEDDMTILHMPVPYPPELTNILEQHLSATPTYKDVFDLGWFKYGYDADYEFPQVARRSLIAVSVNFSPMHRVTFHIHDSSVPGDIRDCNGRCLGIGNTLGMSMPENGGRMRSFPVPDVILDVVLANESLIKMGTDGSSFVVVFEPEIHGLDKHQGLSGKAHLFPRWA